MTEILRLADNKISVYLRRLRGGDCYYARFKVDNPRLADGQRYVTKSLGTSNLEVACDKARMRLAEIQFLERNGRSLVGGTVREEIDAFIADYDDGIAKKLSGFTTSMRRGFQKSIVRYFREYLGRKRLQDVSYEDLRDYEKWRQSYYERARESGKRVHASAKEHASARTIEWEINAFKQLLRWAQNRGKYSGNALGYRYDVGIRNARSALTQQQWDALQAYMRGDGWTVVGKSGNDARLVRYRRMLRAYVLFLANSGLRVGEARNLHWRDLTFHTADKSEASHLSIAIAHSSTKVKKGRVAIGTVGAYNAMRRLLQERKRNKDYAKPTDLIWCDTNGKLIRDFREGFNNLIRAAGVEFDSENKKLTLYSVRHLYITKRLKAGVDVYQLATNCGTSVQMIEQYYAHARSEDFAHQLTKGFQPR